MFHLYLCWRAQSVVCCEVAPHPWQTTPPTSCTCVWHISWLYIEGEKKETQSQYSTPRQYRHVDKNEYGTWVRTMYIVSTPQHIFISSPYTHSWLLSVPHLLSILHSHLLLPPSQFSSHSLQHSLLVRSSLPQCLQLTIYRYVTCMLTCVHVKEVKSHAGFLY